MKFGCNGRHWPWQHEWSAHPEDPFVDVCECGKMRQVGDPLQNYFPDDLFAEKKKDA